VKTVAAPWVGQMLHVDLTTGETRLLPTEAYIPAYLGGRGLAARLAWEMIPPGMGAFDEGNPLMFVPGALVGTPVPSGGRTTVCGLSPQAYPDEWYTRANLGGHWGAELKYAGYDGLVVTGRSAQPVYLYIEDHRVALRDASSLWGLGLIEAQRCLRQELGDSVRALAIGPAGERRCRFAVIATGTESAAGQGGFGAVMGSKNLKAIAVRGHGAVRVANPLEALRRSQLVASRVLRRYGRGYDERSDPSMPGDRRPAPCTYLCPRACGDFRRGVPGVVQQGRSLSGQLFCCSPLFGQGRWGAPALGAQVGFELAQLANDLGLNHWEFIFGLGPWILACQERGELLELEGQRLDLGDASFWVELMRRIAYRQGWGDLLAEGGPRVAATLGIGQDLIGRFYPAWGQASHWDGHGSFASPYFPYWLVTSLQWALDTRDPMGGGHGYTTHIYGLVRDLEPKPGHPADELALQKLRAVGEHLYGSPEAVDPRSGYEHKAAVALFHHDRAALKDSLGICDNIFPMLTDPQEEDFLARVDGAEGQHLEHYLFEAVAECTLSREAFYRSGERIFSAERLLAIRNWGRSRLTDETIIPYLERPESSVNPWIGQPVALDRARYRAMLDEYYRLRGWDAHTTQPSPETLRALGMSEYL